MTKSYERRREYVKAINKQIKEELKARDMNVGDLADITGIPRGTLYNNIEMTFALSLPNFAKICSVLNLDKVLGVRR